MSNNGTTSVSVPMFYRVRGMALVVNPPVTVTITNGMALIPAGVFTMGDTLDGLSDAIPTNVTLSGFYVDVTLVSLDQWRTVYSYATHHGYRFVHEGLGKAGNHPVVRLDWYDCVKWSNARSQQAGLVSVYYTDAGLTQVYTNEVVTVYQNMANNGYRLPTKAEWERAARGGLSGQRLPQTTLSRSSIGTGSSTSRPKIRNPLTVGRVRHRTSR